MSGAPLSVPEGRRRRLAGGMSARADAAPGNVSEWVSAPAGHRRNSSGVCRALAMDWFMGWVRFLLGGERLLRRLVARGMGTFFDAPLGHGPFGGPTGGRARCAGLPPANFLRGPSGTRTNRAGQTSWVPIASGGTAKISRHVKLLLRKSFLLAA